MVRAKTRNAAPTDLATLIGDSPVIAAIRRQVDRITDSTASVLITGPSGSGKDIVARLLHQRGKRAGQPFVALNCAAVPRELLESELFGHEAGAFTGAIKARAGRFEAATGGTLFLDELGDMSLEMQAKLLRVLETRIVERVGGMLPIAVDTRVVAATSVDLDAAVSAGRFRPDLLFRLDVVRLEMPALDRRPGDIPALVAHFTAAANAADRVSFDDAAIAVLMARSWPGNVRELKNIVDRAQALMPGAHIDCDALSAILRPVCQRTASPRHALADPVIASEIVDLKQILAGVEQAYILDALSRSGGLVAASARLLGLQRTTLVEKMRRLNIGTA